MSPQHFASCNVYVKAAESFLNGWRLWRHVCSQGVGSHLSSQHSDVGGKRSGVQGQSSLHRKLETSLGYKRLCSNKYRKSRRREIFTPAHNRFWVEKGRRAGGQDGRRARGKDP